MAEYVYKDYEREKVPESGLRSWWNITAVQFGYMFGSTALIWAMQFTKGFTFKQILITLIVGHFISFWIFYLNGMIGVKERMSTFYCARLSFGSLGSNLVGVLVAFAILGWMGAQVGATALAVNAATGWNVTALNIIIGLCMTLTAVIGYKGISKLSNFSVPYFIVICVIGLFIAANKLGGFNALFAIQPKSPMPLVTGITAVVGSIAVMGVTTPDISRYARTNWDLGWAVGISCVIGHMVIPVAGVLMAMAVGSTNIGQVVFGLLGWWGVLMIVTAGWTTGDNNIYSSALAMTAIIPKIPKWVLSLILGIIGTAAATAGIVNHLMSWLSLLSALAPPVFGVMQADYFILPMLGIERSLVMKEKKQFNLGALIAWALGAYIALHLKWGVVAINSIVSSIIIYLVITVISVKAFGKTLSIGNIGNGSGKTEV